MPTASASHWFSQGPDRPWETVAPGVRRQVLTYDAALMMVKVAFEAGAVGTRHQHPHTQACYVASGVFAVSIGEETRELRGGDTFHVPANEWHGVVCRQAGELIDVFTPMREDFV
ncbi:cupin domain-containing protein [Hymenobacter sp. B81]|uniref:cupin domain-containing protein n=1 Tax=Hymenobacter sp. B81 TaxID=3344878 RepID=UPI0037DC5806